MSALAPSQFSFPSRQPRSELAATREISRLAASTKTTTRRLKPSFQLYWV